MRNVSSLTTLIAKIQYHCAMDSFDLQKLKKSLFFNNRVLIIFKILALRELFGEAMMRQRGLQQYVYFVGFLCNGLA